MKKKPHGPATTSPPQQIRLLGKFELVCGQQSIIVPHAKQIALLTLLAAERQPLRRDYLAELLWPEQEDELSRNSLRGALHGLRRTLGHELLCSDRREAWLADGAENIIDLHCFLDASSSTAVRHETQPTPDELEPLTRAASYYRGQLLAGFTLAGCSDFEDWLHLQRLSLQRSMLGLLERLVAGYQASGELHQAIHHAERLSAIDPCNEEAHRRLIRLLASSGQHGSALAQFELMSQTLSLELGVQPDVHSRALLDEVQRQQQSSSLQGPGPVAVPTGSDDCSFCFVTVASVEIETPSLSGEESAPALLQARRRIHKLLEQHGAHTITAPQGGLLAYFGYPSGQERAAVTAVTILQRLCFFSPGEVTRLRAGVDSGRMLTNFCPQLPDLLGELTASAMALSRHGPAATTTVSKATAALLDDTFALLPAPGQPASYYVEKPLASSAVAPPQSPRPLIGRQREQAQLGEFWNETVQGASHAVLLVAGAGVGKSRLAAWICDEARGADVTVESIRCQPEHRESTLYPVVELLRRHGEFSSQYGEDACNELAKLLQSFDCPLPYPDAARHLAQTLGLTPPDQTDQSTLTQRRKSSLQLLCSLLAAWARHKPLLLMVEDIHWADPSTLEWLSCLNHQAPPRLMLLATARPDHEPAWMVGMTQTILSPLSADDACRLLQSLCSDLKPADIDAVVEIADGTPLFIEQLGCALSEGSLNQGGRLPNTLDEVLAARMGSLGNARRLAQIAATLGHTFNLNVLRAVANSEGLTMFKQGLSSLARSRLINLNSSRHGHFVHALIRDTAYATQSRALQRSTHQRIATLWPLVEPATPLHHPQWLAEHHAAAGEFEQALDLWRSAGDQAIATGAHVDAAAHFRAALVALDNLPPAPHLDDVLIDLAHALGSSLVACQGYGSSEARQVFGRALEVATTLGDSEELFRPLFGLWLGSSSHGDYDTSLRVAHKLERVAQCSGSLTQRIQAAYALGNNYLWCGHFIKARSNLQKAVTLYRQAPSTQEILVTYGEDPGVTSLAFLSWVHWFLGDQQKASEAADECLQLATHLNHPFTLAFALTFVARLQQLRGDVEKMAVHAHRLTSLAERYDFPLWHACGLLFLGWCSAMRGKSEGIAMAEHGLAIAQQTMPSIETTFLAILAEMLLAIDDPARALLRIEQALQRSESLRDHYIQAELLRLQGESMIRLGRVEGGEILVQATQLAERQGAIQIAQRCRQDDTPCTT